MIAAIIQARMTSNRLPGKVMKQVMGKPLLGYLVERLRACSHLDNVIIATTVNAEDDVIANYANQEKMLVCRGSEHDVLSRYYESAKEFGVDHIARITSDCPLSDPAIVDRTIKTYLEGKYDYVHLAPSFAEGLDTEIFSLAALEIAHGKARLRSEREHVTLYFYNNPGAFRKLVIENETDDGHYRITVDEPEDFEVVKAVIEALYEKDSIPFSFGTIKSFLDDHPEILRKNSHIIRNEGLQISLINDGFIEDDER
ncbi:MAG: glycosyltransferase family protein [Chloroflexi bacterium]|jgi:spore coat polysaccharide biosynthesis protein SpsF|nr:glycosyltransferase family protein [Chloroflexota bacterium]